MRPGIMCGWLEADWQLTTRTISWLSSAFICSACSAGALFLMKMLTCMHVCVCVSECVGVSVCMRACVCARTRTRVRG